MASCSSSKFTFHVASTTSNEVRQITGRTLACVLIQLEGWLDKTRVEIVALDCSTPATIRLRYGLKFGSVNVICVDSMRIRFASRERDFNAHSKRI